MPSTRLRVTLSRVLLLYLESLGTCLLQVCSQALKRFMSDSVFLWSKPSFKQGGHRCDMLTAPHGEKLLEDGADKECMRRAW
jgi:hypothetical protein